MKFRFFFFLLTSLPFNGYSQRIDERIDKYVNQQSIDSFLIYSRMQDGGFISPDSCEWEEPRYLFWFLESQWFVKRFDYCKTYKTVKLDSINPFRFYLIYKDKIDEEEIRQPMYYETVVRKGKKRALETRLTASHQPYHEFNFVTGKKSKIVSASEFYLQFEWFDNGRRNVNYLPNQKTKLSSLIAVTENLVKQLKIEKELVTK